MAMVVVDDSCLQADWAQVTWLGLRVDGRLALNGHGHDDSTINIVMGINIIIILLLLTRDNLLHPKMYYRAKFSRSQSKRMSVRIGPELNKICPMEGIKL